MSQSRVNTCEFFEILSSIAETVQQRPFKIRDRIVPALENSFDALGFQMTMTVRSFLPCNVNVAVTNFFKVEAKLIIAVSAAFFVADTLCHYYFV